ncbi:putative thioredoxin peroxidase [Filobasidium floriforme]|uniref:putative thioredoxin peroxidase n=1 Tax=Filobasidium floriforme TaxID=5210 RepID=UPI001E8DABE2|nr:putative thioredoxin peroxidase [Filobasidium floriforme]KAH8080145.1 putative thioredoxin peroxidase [Filobasidium floriforme]
MVNLRLGSIAPDFKAETSAGDIEFHKWAGDDWVMLFSHPDDFTPVCTTELGGLAKRHEEFKQRGVKLLGLSANDVASHHEWIKDVDEISGSSLSFPIIGDKERKVATTYDMLDALDASNVDALGLPLTVRSVFIIDPKKVIRLIISYPASTGRNVDELLRVIDSLQVSAKYKVATPVDWVPGQDVIVANSVKKEEADQLFPGYKSVKPYLRYTADPSKK